MWCATKTLASWAVHDLLIPRMRNANRIHGSVVRAAHAVAVHCYLARLESLLVSARLIAYSDHFQERYGVTI